MNARRAAPVVAGLLATALYLPAIRNDFVFDDRGIVLENPLLLDLHDLPRLFAAPYWNTPRVAGGGLYRPVTSATFALDRAAARGFRPAWFHFVNALLNGAVTALATCLALRLFPGTAAALAAGVLFAVHPVHTEAVAGIVGRAEILAAGFTLAAILADDTARRRAGPGGRRAAILGPCFVLLAILSKESALMAPLLILLFARVRGTDRSGGEVPRRGRWLLFGYAVAVATALGLRAFALGGLGPQAIPFVDNPAAAQGALRGRFMALAVVPRMALLLVWPRRLSADYSYAQIPLPATLFDSRVLLGALLGAALLVLGVRLFRARRPAGFALLLLPASLLLTCNLVVFIGTLLAERLLYLPSLAVCLLAGALVASYSFRPVLAAVGLLACLGAVRTAARLPEWHDDFALYRSAAMVSPRSARIRYNLGNTWLQRGDFAQAEAEYRKALDIYPDFADALGNLGMAYLQEGKEQAALETLQRASERLPKNAEIRVNLGSARRFLGDEAGAEAEFLQAIALVPDSANAWNNLGSLRMRRDDLPGAIAALEKAVAANPGFALFRVNLADAYNAAGRPEDARRQFEEAARLEPSLPEVARGRGEAALQRGDREAAEREFRTAARGSPPSARSCNWLGWILSQRGDLSGAVAAYEKALALDPSLWDAHRSLGLIYADGLHDAPRAAEHFRRSLALEPRQPGADALRARIAALEQRR
ncbi:MAG TPA: tetratricopeptide repeat protein [Candidatus Polarisedimenticolia bacterium]|nr:tetratricopeptide repeat protein [Candidatus Polarisedimenticolia bacterium]